MIRIFFFVSALTLLSFSTTDNTLSKKERTYAVKFLKDTQNGVTNAIKGLSDVQLKFKPAADRWSLEECLKHIAATEQALWGMTDTYIKQPANPEKRSEIKSSDEDIIKMIENRTQKAQAADPLKPENTPFKSIAEAQESFNTSRAKLVEYVNTTKDDLRNHVATLPIGMFDCYQMILFMGAHSNRHTQQMEEIKADPNFPKN